LSMGGMEQSVSPILLSTGTITDEKQVQDSARYSWQRCVMIYSYHVLYDF